MAIVWLGQDNCQDCTLIGGKGATLGHLATTYRVPPAFCVTAAALAHWLPTKPDSSVHLPEPLYRQVSAAYAQLGVQCGRSDVPVAVRSSAVEEDGPRVSLAGQHDTYLNVVGPVAVARALLACWASAWSPHAIAYRQHQGLTTTAIQMAVLVQQLIPADRSAVVFSANPVTGSRSEVVINATWGLGESVVSGTATPDTWIVRRADLAVIATQLADKQQMTVPVSGGIAPRPVPRWLRSQPSLTPEQCRHLAQMAVALEVTMGWPVDIECVWRNDRLYLLQCRPITAIPELMTDPLTRC
ncbi:MAG: PEP/pyruvate-binding domain-containing protein [Caldilineaceae bacterium]|nr:PEP/pyruvate-binding domain-containing protein [Caldilineaceae bacterium]